MYSNYDIQLRATVRFTVVLNGYELEKYARVYPNPNYRSSCSHVTE